ncbi:MAG: hypothetical protein LUQ11_07900 [Methylococcaceae bacterium]|nr:hypothetical protein [Methylococcaceae bacterium]
MGQDTSVLYTVTPQGAQQTNLSDVFDYNVAKGAQPVTVYSSLATDGGRSSPHQ